MVFEIYFDHYHEPQHRPLYVLADNAEQAVQYAAKARPVGGTEIDHRPASYQKVTRINAIAKDVHLL